MKPLRRNGLFLLLGSFLAAASGQSALAAELRAGTAKIDITPTQPVKLAGYESRKELSQGVHDPLGARALAFEQDGKRLIFVSVDSLGFYNDTAEAFRKMILGTCRLKPAELFMCAIHTHSAPTLTLDAEKGPASNVEYTKNLQNQLADVVETSLNRLAPVQVGIGLGSSPVGVNRREVVQDEAGKSKIVLGRNPSAMTDREVQILKLVRPGTDQLAGALFAYATHSTSLGPKNYLVSGDIHGLAEEFLEKYLGADVIVPGFAGASGNIDPWVRVLPEFRNTNGWLPEPVLMGTMLGEEVARGIEEIRNVTTNTTIGSSFATVALPSKARADAAAPPSSTAPFNIAVGRLGDVAFVGWGGEVFNEIGKAVKSGSPFRQTFILTHCNGAAGYLPTRPSYSEGGYEVQSSSFGPGAAEALIDETLQMLRQLHDVHE